MNNFFMRVMTGAMLVSLFFITFFHAPARLFSIILGAILTIIIIDEWPKIFAPSSSLFWILLPLYPIAPFLFLILLNESSTYRILIYYIFIIVSTFDSGSYLTGKMYGKHKIIPSISPGKSWEGAIGGYCITTLMLACIIGCKNMILSWQTVCLLSAFICTIAFAGDIFESYLKRSANLKDSGTLLPGHGGFLDRFDAIMFVSLFFFFYKERLLTLLIA